MFKTILVALDGSQSTEQVMEALGQFRLESETKVILSHVVPATGYEFELIADKPHIYGDEVPYRHIEKLLESYQEKLPCQSEIEIVTGDVAEEIVRLANIYHADLIVIGCRGLTGLKRILEGSVSSQVVGEAVCSVLVVKGI
ncbi:universal stress protein [Oscillatoriales cyanobacterium USR001]|nr:universal stress protein [Oscillatoriales cyanobacterium USR001]